VAEKIAFQDFGEGIATSSPLNASWAAVLAESANPKTIRQELG